MRTIHVSDLHLSKDNLDSFSKFYLDALIKDLKKWNASQKIELVFLTGDIIDKGGKSLNQKNPYTLVEEIFVNKLLEALQLPKERVIIIPGNHDADSSKVKQVTEGGLLALKSIDEINTFVNENRSGWHEGIQRIQDFKNFETEFYQNASDYYLSNYESCFIFRADNLKIGVAALNSAWRCSPSLPGDKLFLGTSQILNAKDFFQKNGTNLNILLVHHPIELYSQIERNEIKNFISNFNFHAVLCGHTHSADLNNIIGINGNLFISVAKSAFNNPRESYDVYKPGYTIIDFIVANNGEVEINSYFRKYVHNRVVFDKDVDTSEDGFYKAILPTKINLPADFQGKDLGRTSLKDPIVDAWNKVTEVLINSSFPTIGAKMGGLIKQYMFPESFDRYNKDLHLSYEITRLDENHFVLLESQTLSIVSDQKAFNFTMYYYVEKKNTASDLSDITVHEFTIDGADHIEFIEKSEKSSGSNIQKTITFGKILEGQDIYHIRKVTKSIHSLKLNGIWKYDINRITENLSLNVRNLGNFELDLIKYGNSALNFLESSPFLDTQTINYEDLLMPGEGFILVVKSKEVD